MVLPGRCHRFPVRHPRIQAPPSGYRHRYAGLLAHRRGVPPGSGISRRARAPSHRAASGSGTAQPRSLDPGFAPGSSSGCDANVTPSSSIWNCIAAPDPALEKADWTSLFRGFQVDGALPKYHDFEVPLPRHMPEWQCFYQVLGMEIPRTSPGHSTPKELIPREPASRLRPAGSLAAQVRPARKQGASASSSVLPSTGPRKNGPGERYAELITLMATEGHDFILLARPMKREEGGRIAALAKGKMWDATGILDFEGLRREVAACDLVVGTIRDHAPGRACGVPTVTLFGPTDPGKWNPLTSTPVFLDTSHAGHATTWDPCLLATTFPACGSWIRPWLRKGARQAGQTHHSKNPIPLIGNCRAGIAMPIMDG